MIEIAFTIALIATVCIGPVMIFSAAVAGKPDEPQARCDYCGFLGWTVEAYGVVSHKCVCPFRVDPWCQSHPVPDGCPEPTS